MEPVKVEDTMANHAKQYEEAKNAYKTLGQDIQGEVKVHPDYEEFKACSNKAKMLKEKIESESLINELKEKRKQTKERMNLLEEIIRINMIEQQLTLFNDFDGRGQFKQVIKSKYESKREKEARS